MTRKLVKVTWVDSCGTRGWTDKQVAKAYSPDTVKSIGWVMGETRGHLTIAAHIASNQVDGLMSIPKSAIRSLKTVK